MVALSEEELKKIIEETKDDIRDIDEVVEDDADGKPSTVEIGKDEATDDMQAIEDEMAKYHLETYDEEDFQDNPLSGIGSLTYYASNNEDPYITLRDDKDEDDENLVIKPTDNLILAGHVERDCSNLDVYVYNEEEKQLFIHHDILLPAFPLCVEWIDFDPSDNSSGNFAAVGSLSPHIDVWDLDVIDCIEPAYQLGKVTKKTKKARKSKNTALDAHEDAVLDLSWNKQARHILASGSADFTVGLWDLNSGKMAMHITEPQEKVQSLVWHPFESQSLLTGCCDHKAMLFDCRDPSNNHKAWQFDGEVERVIWNHFEPFYFLASTETGFVYYVDVRQTGTVFTLRAHTKAVTGLSLSNHIAGCLTTVSADRTCKIWDLKDNKPECVLERDLHLGHLQCCTPCPDAPYIVAIGGEQSSVKVWDIKDNATVRNHFSDRQIQIPKHLEIECPQPETSSDVAETTNTTDAMETLSIEPTTSSSTSYVGSKMEKKKKKNKSKKSPLVKKH
ncbi:PREDICTED: periodic tryptophan protein 1 homolog isoform X2 [Priapulus caudatus]|uniref:Periodic tryptophan protein 1 homolog isoform X2 n=1 Tax=Priapulus caudatus TaxID=37621 RepID=A0ABM1ELD8_PRICU|nr:PREDICTED: periodic tryptophan protein 1 homolog isoform X2 [Priapulus caudatus]